MNATKIRRHLWTEIAEMDVEDFALQGDGAYSEPAEEAKRFERVDREGYQVRENRWEEGEDVSLDSLITAGRESLSQPVTSECVLQIRGRSLDRSTGRSD